MTPNTITPSDRAAFDAAKTAIRSDHARLRSLAVAASRLGSFSADDAMSLAEAMLAHESAEDCLFAPSFVSNPPETVISTGARVRRRCLEYTSGNYKHPKIAAALFVDALLIHLAVEDA